VLQLLHASTVCWCCGVLLRHAALKEPRTVLELNAAAAAAGHLHHRAGPHGRLRCPPPHVPSLASMPPSQHTSAPRLCCCPSTWKWPLPVALREMRPPSGRDSQFSSSLASLTDQCFCLRRQLLGTHPCVSCCYVSCNQLYSVPCPTGRCINFLPAMWRQRVSILRLVDQAIPASHKPPSSNLSSAFSALLRACGNSVAAATQRSAISVDQVTHCCHSQYLPTTSAVRAPRCASVSYPPSHVRMLHRPGR
jgi:hypothetical protein